MNTTEFNDSQFSILLKEIKSTKVDLEKTIVEEIRKNKQDLTNLIQTTETKLLLKIEGLNKKVNVLEQENHSLKQQIESLERVHKKKNIIIYGLEESDEEVTPITLCEGLNKLLEIQLHPGEISNLYSFGRPESRAIKAEFTTLIAKQSVIQNTKKLKGTKVSITQDLTKKQQEINKKLRQHLAIARRDKNKRSYIRGEKLLIDNIGYSIQDLEQNTDLESVESIQPNKRNQRNQEKTVQETQGYAKEEVNVIRKNQREDEKFRKEDTRQKESNKIQPVNTQTSYKTRAQNK